MATREEPNLVTDLVEFLRARLDDDEQAARAASPGPWHMGDIVHELHIADVIGADGRVTSAYSEPCCSVEDAAHIARHDPARVLREVEAGRRLIKRYELAVAATESVSSFVSGQDDGYRQACLDAIKDAAEVHADRPDYREEHRT